MDRDHAPQPVCLRPDPLFATKTPAGRRLSCPVPPLSPGGQPDTRCSGGGPRVGQLLRWARCPDDGRLHLLRLAEVLRATAGDHAQALCGQRVPADGLTNGLSCALCTTCITGIPDPDPDPSGGIAP
ncbi:MAG: hypothetical protein ACRDQ9_02975 [Pseudonocardiaceae bacterium]